MKNSAKRRQKKMMNMTAGALLAVALLFPPSSSVLCISPGRHVAVEAANAPCCDYDATAHIAESETGGNLSETNHCCHCTDIFLGSMESGLPCKSNQPSPSDIGTAEGTIAETSEETTRSSLRSGINDLSVISPIQCLSAPLRC